MFFPNLIILPQQLWGVQGFSLEKKSWSGTDRGLSTRDSGTFQNRLFYKDIRPSEPGTIAKLVYRIRLLHQIRLVNKKRDHQTPDSSSYRLVIHYTSRNDWLGGHLWDPRFRVHSKRPDDRSSQRWEVCTTGCSNDPFNPKRILWRDMNRVHGKKKNRLKLDIEKWEKWQYLTLGLIFWKT